MVSFGAACPDRTSGRTLIVKTVDQLIIYDYSLLSRTRTRREGWLMVSVRSGNKLLELVASTSITSPDGSVCLIHRVVFSRGLADPVWPLVSSADSARMPSAVNTRVLTSEC